MLSKILRFTLDAIAAAALGGAVCYALMGVLQLPAVVAIAGGGVVFARVLYGLARLPADKDAFTPFEVASLEFEDEDELLLDRPVGRDGAQVVRLFDPIPTPGELHHTIERHLRGTVPGADASGELQDALAELRRAIR